MTNLNGVNDALKNGLTIKLENRGKSSSGIIVELKSVFDEMTKIGLIKDKDGKGITKREAFNMYQKLNEIHQTTGKSTNYTKMHVGQEFQYTKEELIQLAEASGFEIVTQEKMQPQQTEIKPFANTPAKGQDTPEVAVNEGNPVMIQEVVITGKALVAENSTKITQQVDAKRAEKKPKTEPATPKIDVSETKQKPAPAQNKFSIGKIATPFEQDTVKMLYTNTNVQTKFLKQANSLLGTVEYVKQAELSAAEKQKTQAGIIGGYGNSNHQWCAHAVSTIAERSGVKIGGHYAQVQQFINWGAKNGIYNKVPDMAIDKTNFQDVRAAKAESISAQLPNMNEGDLIIWKSPYAAKTDIGVKIWAASHIGILESIDVENGTITVLEGNANIPKSDDKYERYVVQNRSQGVNGDQVIGEPVELNRTDGLIRKVYTVDDLAKFGYSGFINMQSRVS